MAEMSDLMARTHTIVRQIECKAGIFEVAYTVRELVDKEDHVWMSSVTRTEFDAEWMTQEMANDLWNWQQGGFKGPPPQWAV